MSDKPESTPQNPRNKTLDAYLSKFDIKELNPMQLEAKEIIDEKSDLVLLSPTGTGKTLAFLLPLIETLDPECVEIQLLILVPSRELAQQIEQVIRQMGSGYKVNVVHGGRSGTLDKINLKHRPAVLVGTPGRLADRLRRDNFSLDHIRVIVLDEFDKSLEIGFEKEMTEILETLPEVRQRILTSATTNPNIPSFVGLYNPIFLNYLKEGSSGLTIKTVLSPEKDKLESLTKILDRIGPLPLIVFCNYRAAVERISDYLEEMNIDHGCFHGGMEQVDRERALVKFRNGTNHFLLATDLAARGLDIPEINYIIHYHLPPSIREFTHRNGRTARMHKEGIAYILHWKEEALPDFIEDLVDDTLVIEEIEKGNPAKEKAWKTLFITGGRKDKISKGDVAGLFYKQGEIQKDQLGDIELKQNCTYAAVDAQIAEALIEKTNNSRLKKKKVRISLI